MNGETEKIWYIFDKGIVSGPFIQDEVKVLATSPSASGMIWKRGETDWKPIEEWVPEIPPTKVSSPQEWPNTWYISSKGIHSGPYSIEEICRKISTNEFPVDVKAWTLGFKKWVGLCEISDFTKILGILQRRHRRAPFVGTVTIQGLFKKRSVTAQTISVGGLGVNGIENFRAGSKVGLIVESDLLREPIEARGRIIYQFSTSAGIEFTELDQDGLDVVADYVQQFI